MTGWQRSPESRRRKDAITNRNRLIDRFIRRWLEANHPRLYRLARAAAVEEVNKLRGPLPGDEHA